MSNTVSRTLSDETLNRIIQIESAGKPTARAPTSSAGGLGQFLTSTWLTTIQKYKPDLLRTHSRDQVAAMRFGPDTAALQVEMLARFTEDNARVLGPGYSDGDLYLAHFLGVGTAKKFLRAAPAAPAEELAGEAAVKANRSILEGKTAGQVRAWAQASMEQRWVRAGKPDWVKKYAGAVPVIPPPDIPKPVNQPAPVETPKNPPPLTKKQTGWMAGLSAVAVAVLAWFQQHPFLVGGSVVVIVLAFFIWRLLRGRG